MEESKQRRRRPTYSEDFKRDAVNLVIVEGQTITRAAESVGVSLASMQRWVTKYSPDPRDPVDEDTTFGDLQDEVRRLRKALEQAELERDILKKATAYFAKESR